MTLIVQKYGGSSVGNLDRIKLVADKVRKSRAQGHDVVVIVSAMYGETDRLIRLASALTATPTPREYDVLISTGEQVSMSLLSMALNQDNCPAKSFTGAQIGIVTDSVFTKARIMQVKTDKIKHELAQGFVVVIAGFQGVNQQGDITTLGRGGSDTTAVAIAAALAADECQIYTDVDGVYTTDPHLYPKASLLPQICFEEMLEMSSLGAKVLQMRSVELASRFNLPIRVLSTFSDKLGTLVTFEEQVMQKRLVSGIAFSREEAMISMTNIKRQLGVESRILESISLANIEIDMIGQNTAAENSIDFTFTLNRRDFKQALQLVSELQHELGHFDVKTNDRVAKLSLVGIGMRSHSGVATTMFKALAKARIAVQMITTSEIKISIIIEENMLDTAIDAVHFAFELDKLSAPQENMLIE